MCNSDVIETTFNITWIMVLFIFFRFCMKFFQIETFCLLSFCIFGSWWKPLLNWSKQGFIFPFNQKLYLIAFFFSLRDILWEKQAGNHLVEKKFIMCAANIKHLRLVVINDVEKGDLDKQLFDLSTEWNSGEFNCLI